MSGEEIKNISRESLRRFLGAQIAVESDDRMYRGHLGGNDAEDSLYVADPDGNIIRHELKKGDHILLTGNRDGKPVTEVYKLSL